MAVNILVVEDEPAIQELIAVNLEHAGHHVIRARDAEGAATIVKNALPDLMLIDWMLPGMSGIALAKQMRQQERTRGIPIILLTARSEEHDKVMGLEAGADDYVTKPFSPRELMARIKAVLRRRAPQMTDDPVEIGGLRLDPSTRRVFGNQAPLGLGPTEFRLLHFLIFGARNVAGFKIELGFHAENCNPLPCHEIEPETGLFDNIRLERCAAARHAVACVSDEEGLL